MSFIELNGANITRDLLANFLGWKNILGQKKKRKKKLETKFITKFSFFKIKSLLLSTLE